MWILGLPQAFLTGHRISQFRSEIDQCSLACLAGLFTRVWGIGGRIPEVSRPNSHGPCHFMRQHVQLRV